MKEDTVLDGAWPTDGNSASVVFEFEDNFKPFLKMHDSCAYIASLENRLTNLKGADKRQMEGKEMLDALFRAKDDHMIRHVNEGNGSCLVDEDDENYTEGKLHHILLGKLYPERQALSGEELVHLLSSDKLNQSVRDEEAISNNQTD